MNQLQRTEELLDRGYHWEAIAEARSLAAKIDAILEYMISQNTMVGENTDLYMVRSIIEADQ